MKATLYLLFVTILAAMLWITVTASLSENIMTAGPRLLAGQVVSGNTH